MTEPTPHNARAEAANHCFEREMQRFLRDALRPRACGSAPAHAPTLREFFLHTAHPVQKLLKNRVIAAHLARPASDVAFDPISGDPVFAPNEQRFYNLARRMDDERFHIPFRSIDPKKQIETGDHSDIGSYPADSGIVYNSGNHFSSRPANGNVFDENSKRYSAKSSGNLHVLFKRGFLEERLAEVKETTAALRDAGVTEPQIFVIYSRHSPKEGHFGTSLVIMDAAHPDFPQRVMVCDTLLKDLPQHPRWWPHFMQEYSAVFGEAVTEMVEDLSHPLQKVNIKGDDPYRHDWDCPYYCVSTTNALIQLAQKDPSLLLNGSTYDIHSAMKREMPDYYHPDLTIKDRSEMQQENRLKRWESGRASIKTIVQDLALQSSYARQ